MPNFKFFLKVRGNKKVKFIYYEKTTKFCEIFTLLLSVSVCTVDKSKVEFLQNFVALSEYMNFNFFKL